MSAHYTPLEIAF